MLANRHIIDIVVSDSAPPVGAIVSLAIQVQQPATASPIAAFRARIAFDPNGLEYVGEYQADPGVHAVNVIMDTVRIAGAAPGIGFADGRLVTLRFRVLDPAALKSIAMVVNEIRDLTFTDRHSEFAGGALSTTRVSRIIYDISSPVSSALVYGDATGDLTIDASDALAILTKDVGLTPVAGFDTSAADVNVDGRINALDAQIVLASLVGRDVSQFRLGDVVGSTRITVTSVAPDTLRPGITATITGTNFSSSTVGDTVMIDTVAAVVSAASSTQLTVTVPKTVPCRATHPASVTVRSNGATGHGRQMLVVAPQQRMQVGGVMLFDTDSAFRCNEFSSGHYLIAVYNPTRIESPTPVSFQLLSTSAKGLDSNVIARAVAPVSVRPIVASPLPWNSISGGATMQQRATAHLRFMEQDRQRVTNARVGGARRQAVSPSGGLHPRLDVIQTIGAYSTLHVIPATQSDPIYTVRARTAYVGTHAVILEDSLAPLAGQIDSYYQQLGAEFDNVMFPILTANFGNPMAMDANLSGTGRIVMLFTPVINTKFPGVEAFVTACDFLTPTDCPATNLTEVFYASVPTLPAAQAQIDPRYDVTTPPGWYNQIRGTLIHESKHITALAEKFSRATYPLLEQSWLEEGTAQIASELYARTIYGTAWKGDATYRQTLYCEIRLCANYSFTMFGHFAFLYDYEAQADSLSPINSGYTDATIYGSAWLMARWAADTYAANEPSFFKGLVQQINTNGVDNLEARTGQSWTTLLGRWAIAIAADHYQGFANLPGVPSWNLRDMFLGLYQDQAAFTSPYPLRMPVYNTATFSVAKSVAAGSAAFFDLTFPTAKQSIAIQATPVTNLPAGTPLRLAVIRVQ
jgi:hypothetical protein